MTDDNTPQTMAMQQLQGSGAGQMNDENVRLQKRVEALEAALREIMTNKDEDHWEVNRIARAVLASPAQPLTTDTIDLTNPLPGDPPIQQQPNDAVYPGFRGNNEA
jgi:two-component sensor histidine kinase